MTNVYVVHCLLCQMQQYTSISISNSDGIIWYIWNFIHFKFLFYIAKLRYSLPYHRCWFPIFSCDTIAFFSVDVQLSLCSVSECSDYDLLYKAIHKCVVCVCERAFCCLIPKNNIYKAVNSVIKPKISHYFHFGGFAI